MKFQPGHPGGPGRPKGSRNKLETRVLDAFLADFEQGGPAAIKRVREEDPSTYLRVAAALLPKETTVEIGEGLAALLSGISDRESAGEVSPVEETGTGAVCH